MKGTVAPHTPTSNKKGEDVKGKEYEVILSPRRGSHRRYGRTVYGRASNVKSAYRQAEKKNPDDMFISCIKEVHRFTEETRP